MQYDSSQVSTLKKWVDTDNILSTRKNKTIYIISADNSWVANTAQSNAQFLGNTGAGDRGSAQWSGFSSDVSQGQSMFINNPSSNGNQVCLVYGNLNAASASKVGIAGTLTNGMYYTAGVDGSINVSANLVNLDSSKISNGNLVAAGILPSSINTINVNGLTANLDLSNFYANTVSQTPVWNRLINSNIGANVLVNASTDPCDINGEAITTQAGLAGNARNNEEYRHQFAIRSNPSAQNVDVTNPAYVIRLERFGKNITSTGSLNGNVVMQGFTKQFFSNVRGWDNSIYANGNILSSITITGNVANPDVQLLNGNFYTKSTIDVSPNAIPASYLGQSFSNQYQVVRNLDSTTTDYVVGNTEDNGVLSQNDSLIFVQANLAATTVGTFLPGNVRITSGNVTIGSTVYSNINNVNVLGDSITSTTFSPNPKVITVFGTSVSGSQWNTPQYTYGSGPAISGSTTFANVDLYAIKGGMGIDNFLYGTSTKSTTNNFFSTMPSYFGSVTVPSDIVLCDNANVDGVVSNTLLSSAAANIADYMISKTIQVANVSGSLINITANVASEFHILFYGNSLDNERANVDVKAVVTNGNSFMSNAWTGLNKTVTITYDTNLSSALSVNDNLAKSLPNYKLSFDNWVGKATVPTGIAFAANLSVDGLSANMSANISGADASLLSSSALNNNSHLKSLCLNGVLYSEYTFESGKGKKWTDQGNVCGLDASNYKYTTMLPAYGNAAITSSNVGFSITSDTFLNTLVDYGTLSVNSTDVHKILAYDFQYKAYVDAVKRSGTTDLDNRMLIEGAPLNIDNVFGTTAYNAEVKGNLEAQPFLVHCYTGMSDISPRESMYPFFNVNDTTGRSDANVTSDPNYLFPGFVYKYTASNGYEFFSYRGASDCDFEINTDSAPTAVHTLKVYAVDTENKTVKISLNGGVAKTLPQRPVRLGRPGSSLGKDWYSYVIVYLTNAAGSRDYMVMLYRLNGDAANPNVVPTSLPASVSPYLPVTAQIRPVSQWTENKIKYSVAMRVWDNAGVQNPAYNSSSDYSQVVDLNTFYGPAITSSVNVSVGVNVFSQPLNNLMVAMEYLGSTTKDLITYGRKDFDLNGALIAGSDVTMQYGVPYNNGAISNTVTADSPRLSIAANTVRYYLDGYGSAVYADIDANSNYALSGSVLRVYRSISYNLLRASESVNRGLLTRYANTSGNSIDVITEALAAKKAGFSLSLTHNVVDLSARLAYQNGTTVSQQQSPLEFNMQTLADKLRIQVVQYNPVSAQYVNTILNEITYLRANDLIDLSYRFGGSIGVISLESVRGYRYYAGYSTATDLYSSLFRVRLAPDSYNAYRPVTGGALISSKYGVFTKNHKVIEDAPNAPVLSWDNKSISSTYQQLTAGANTRVARYTSTGTNFVNVLVEEFYGHYNNVLQEYTTGGVTGLNNNHAISSTAYVAANLTGNTFEVSIAGSTQSFTINTAVLPGASLSGFANRYYSIIYTGTVPMVLYRATCGASGTSISAVQSALKYFSNYDSLSSSGLAAPGAAISAESFAVVYPHSDKTSANDYILYRGIKIRTLAQHFTAGKINSWFTVVVNSNLFLQGMLLNYSYGSSSLSVPVSASYEQTASLNIQGSDSAILNGSLGSYRQYSIKQGADTYFKMLVSGVITPENNFNITIGAAKAHFYEAYDMDESKTIGYSALDSLNLSELTYDLSSQSTVSIYPVPRFSVELNNSASWAQGWVAVPNTYMELKFNKKFSVGYALDTFFVLKSNNTCAFSVVEITPALKANGSDAQTELRAYNRRKLRLTAPAQWTLSSSSDSGDLAGLTFKLKADANVVSGDKVTVFCANSANLNNKLQWVVTNSENSTAKTLALPQYDEQRYAEILNQQLNVEQRFLDATL
jgi:hypothetical protein